MANYKWSEIFTSIEGEGPYSGHPTTYIRFAGCNFQCKGFNNPNNIEITNEVLGYNPSDYKDLYDLPPVEIGCDSIYAWDKRFKHLWHQGDENDLAEATLEMTPHKKWRTGSTPVILSLTGGEPTLRIKSWEALLNHPLMNDLSHLLIETNCSVPLRDEHMRMLSHWIDSGAASGLADRLITWSNSPKLSASGEHWAVAINPEVAKQQLQIDNWQIQGYVEQYFKFVCGDSDIEFEEVADAMQAYHEAGIPIDTPVYIMPMACVEDQQNEIAMNVALKCIDRGYIYCHRIHLDVFSNAIGT